MSRRAHWETVYGTRRADEVSWFQPEATLSLELIARYAPDLDAPILDVGGGASRLVDGLLVKGYRRITVLDLSNAALDLVRQRLGDTAAQLDFLAGDVTTHSFDPDSVALWHDRAVFHFLTDSDDRARYVDRMRTALRPGGIAVIATFALDGPTRCSGLDVARYGPDELVDALGPSFTLMEALREEHVTPNGVVQPFTYCVSRLGS